jgi:hypothetical protein
VSKADQYARKAAGWTDEEYADAEAYLAHRAELVMTLGVPVERDDGFSTSRAGMVGSARFSSTAGSVTGASTRSRRWSTRRDAGSASGRRWRRAT